MDQIEKKELLSYEEYVFPMMKFVEKIDDDYSLYQVSNDKDLAKAGDVMKNCIGSGKYTQADKLHFIIDKRRIWKAAIATHNGEFLSVLGKRNSEVDEHTVKAFKKWLGSNQTVFKNADLKIFEESPKSLRYFDLTRHYRRELRFLLLFSCVLILSAIEITWNKTGFLCLFWIFPNLLGRNIGQIHQYWVFLKEYKSELLKLENADPEDIELGKKHYFELMEKIRSRNKKFIERIAQLVRDLYRFGNR